MGRKYERGKPIYTPEQWAAAKPALDWIYRFRGILSRQEYMTLRGQVLAGDTEGAAKGLATLIERRGMG